MHRESSNHFEICNDVDEILVLNFKYGTTLLFFTNKSFFLRRTIFDFFKMDLIRYVRTILYYVHPQIVESVNEF